MNKWRNTGKEPPPPEKKQKNKTKQKYVYVVDEVQRMSQAQLAKTLILWLKKVDLAKSATIEPHTSASAFWFTHRPTGLSRCIDQMRPEFKGAARGRQRLSENNAYTNVNEIRLPLNVIEEQKRLKNMEKKFLQKERETEKKIKELGEISKQAAHA